MLAEVEEARWISPTGAVARREAERVRAVLAERRSSAGVSERAHRLRQMKAGAWERVQAVAAVRRATPAHGRHAARAP